jgi:glutaminyl-tRNA synthetase
MRFDDTNPAKEDIEYVNAILRDVKWLTTGEVSPSVDETAQKNPWNGEVRHASDYFQAIYDAAMYLVKTGMAYVDDSTPGNPTYPSQVILAHDGMMHIMT